MIQQADAPRQALSAVRNGPRRSVFLALVCLAALTTCAWRVQLGLRPLPGLFTVVFVPVSVALFVIVDRHARFSSREWASVTALICVHMVLSVPTSVGPLYYVGGRIVRPDHLVHVLGGALVAWLVWDVLGASERLRPFALVTSVFVLTLAFGLAKETTDLLSTTATHVRHDWLDSAVDFAANGIGAAIAVARRIRARHG